MKETKKQKRPEQCRYISYAVHPQHQPIIVDDKFYCKYCGNEVEVADCMFPGNPGWFHKSGGEFIIVPIAEEHKLTYKGKDNDRKRKA